ncbi:MAG: hypothetical protein J2O49_11180, partial [Sciscionella sp.]|nr:hypothetical protein [Sciscionella sp.]
MGGNVLIAEQFAGNGGASGKLDAPSTHRRRLPQLPLSRSASFVRQHPGVVSDVVAVVFAALDIFLVVPTQEQGGAHLYQYILMAIACVALVLRRRFPFAVTVITIPGFLVGWSPLAAMIALGTLAWKRGFGWKLICAGLL